jgi:3-methyladenine DNA glycosylase AlkD
MASLEQVMAQLQAKGSDQTRKIYARHGIPQPMFGVSIADLKVIAKSIRGDQSIARALYDTGNHDAMYLAGIVADGSQMTKRQLQAWAKSARSGMIAEYTVPGVAAESSHARELALAWIDAKSELVACCGWSTYAGLLATRPDEELDLEEIATLVERVAAEIHAAPNRVRYAMNAFVIAVGAYVKPLLKQAKRAAKQIGTVEVDMGDTSCKVPLATDYIAKIEKMGRVGKKRTSAKC